MCAPRSRLRMCNYEGPRMNTVRPAVLHCAATVRRWAFVLSIVITAAGSAVAQDPVQAQWTKAQQIALAERTFTEAKRLSAQSASESDSEIAARKYEEAAAQYRAASDAAGEAKALAKLAELLQFSCDLQRSVRVALECMTSLFCVSECGVCSGLFGFVVRGSGVGGARGGV